MDSFSLDVEHPENHIAPDDSIRLYRAAVLFESEALWQEKDLTRRANIARQLAELAATLAEMEEAEARTLRQRSSTSDAAA